MVCSDPNTPSIVQEAEKVQPVNFPCIDSLLLVCAQSMSLNHMCPLILPAGLGFQVGRKSLESWRGALARKQLVWRFDSYVCFLLELPQSHMRICSRSSWVIAGSKTESGLPILCNDTHLKLGSPNINYLVHLHTEDGINASGGTIPGLFSLTVGRTQDIAWGVTLR